LRKSAEEVLKESNKFSINECLVANGELREIGMTTALVSRKIVDGRLIYAVYCIDLYCLGVKDTFAMANVTMDEYVELRRDFVSRFDMVPIDYEDCRSLVLGAVNFARNLGFEPNEDWRDSQFVVEADLTYEPKFEFGKDGKPLYIQGPSDNPGVVISTLKSGNHDFAVAAPMR
jgi:hypothetical protein